MKFSIPIYVEEQREPNTAGSSHLVRPVFFKHPVERSVKLARAMTELGKAIRKILTSLAAGDNHAELVEWTYSPEMELREVRVDILPKQTGKRLRFPVILIPEFDRQIAHVPNLAESDIWFELRRDEDLTVKTEEVLREHFRDAKEEPEEADPLKLELSGHVYVTTLDFELELPEALKKRTETKRSSRESPGTLQGGAELERVGICLDWQYPDDLERALKREVLVQEILALWEQKDRRPLLLAGPRKVGKTALVHECIHRRMTALDSRQAFRLRGTTWHISPQRLIAGMSYVGQWEERLLAILTRVRRQNLRLFIDDLLGLFQAGISSESNLCVADVLKPFLERREVALIAEITPEALRVLRERDRSFADLFQIIPVPETNEADTLAVLLAQRRHLEDQHDCRFELDALPTVMDLQRRYVKDAAFPGKAVAMLKQVAVRKANQPVTRADMLEAFKRSSGLALGFLNDRSTLARSEIVEGIGQRVIGQSEAVEAAADAICLAKARLNEPGRPLACFLFLGPTGVGKTQCAKAIAAYLFSDPERLVRIDLNEYVGSDAVGRLSGTFQQPEGVFTGAIRRQPFAVLLLDEVEKASPDVLDLLLQVLGEARLTDALGRTADFSNTIIIMTSNLGAREASRSLGFGRSPDHAALSFRRAAERFFRPEFFNRIDRVIPFTSLARQENQQIADRLLAEIRAREGLKRWRCELRISAQTAEDLASRGFHPELGARALKRVIEREIIHPLGVQLARMKPGNPGIIRILAAEAKVVVQSEELRFAERRAAAGAPPEKAVDGLVNRLHRLVHHYAERLDRLAPAQNIATEAIRPEQRAYFAAQEQKLRVQRLIEELQEDLDRAKHDPKSFSMLQEKVARNRTGARLWRYYGPPVGVQLADLLAREAMRELVLQMERRAKPSSASLEETQAEILQETALLDLLVRSCEHPSTASKVLCVFGAHLAPKMRAQFAIFVNRFEEDECLVRAIESIPGLELESLNGGGALEGPPSLMDEERYAKGFLLSGVAGAAIADASAGTVMEIHEDERIVLRQVIAVPLASDEPPEKLLKDLMVQQAAWLTHSAKVDPQAAPDPGPFAFGPIIRIIDHRNEATVDLRTGAAYRKASLSPEEMRWLILSQLPRPGFWEELS